MIGSAAMAALLAVSRAKAFAMIALLALMSMWLVSWLTSAP